MRDWVESTAGKFSTPVEQPKAPSRATTARTGVHAAPPVGAFANARSTLPHATLPRSTFSPGTSTTASGAIALPSAIVPAAAARSAAIKAALTVVVSCAARAMGSAVSNNA